MRSLAYCIVGWAEKPTSEHSHSEKGETVLSFLKSVMLFLMMPMMSVLLPVDFFKNEDNFK